jgi:hypothetical protein
VKKKLHQFRKTLSDAMFEKRMAAGLLLVLVILSLLWYLTPHYPMPARVAAEGGAIAFVGVLVMAIPVLRVGPFNWVAHIYFDGNIDASRPTSFEVSADEKENLDRQRRNDLINQNLVGPYLVGIGTIINGFSGFF